MRRATRLTLVVLAALIPLLATSCFRSSPVVREIESPDWQHAVETDHYLIYTNISRGFVENAAVVAERAYGEAVKRLRVADDDPAYVKTLERSIDELPKEHAYTWDDGTQLYHLPGGVKLVEWPSENTVRRLELADGRTFTFWDHARYGRKVPVYLCRTQDELDAWFPNKGGPGRGGWGPAAGVIGIITTSENRYYDLDNLAHEIGHQCLSYCVYGPPVWLDEGLAMYAGVDHTTGKYRSGAVKTAMLKTCAKAAAEGTLVPVAELVRMDFKTYHFSDDEWLHYAQSWALVHCLMRSKHPELRGKLRPYLDELKKGRDAQEALEELYNLDVLQQEYVRYIKAVAKRQLGHEAAQRDAAKNQVAGGLLLPLPSAA